ncbi:MAG TPA: hypothetical protein VH309_01350, partial [Elusimicrobiota bacterium]|nr:hypothetical protein [Elusimicrobiota bacterium]
AREEGAALADLDVLFARRAPGGVPGWESFADGVHPRPQLNMLVARALAAAAAGEPVEPLARKFPPAPRRRPGPELDELAWSSFAVAAQAGLRSPPPLLERAVAGLEVVARVDPKTLTSLLGDPAALSRAFSSSAWTRPLAVLVPSVGASLRAHVAEALRRARLASGPRAGKLL